MSSSSSSSSSSSGIGVLGLLGCACGVITWSWWWVTAPFWGGAALGLLVFLVAFIVAMWVHKP